MKSVIKGAGYILVHTPDMVIHNGTTQTTERIVNPESEYLKELPGHIRSFEDVLSYYPNQVYIGNVTPDELAEVPQPWCDKVCPKNGRFGQFGQMMPQEEFLLLMQACDVFELVYLDKDFVAENKTKLAENPLIDETVMARVNDGIELAEIERLVDLKAEISGAISQLANVDEQLLLRFRYINNYGWEKIAVLMSVSMRTVHRIHASALRDFQPPA